MLKCTWIFGIKQNSKYSHIQNQYIKNENGQSKCSDVSFYTGQLYSGHKREVYYSTPSPYFWAGGLPCKVIKTHKQQDWKSSPLDSDRMQINKWFRQTQILNNNVSFSMYLIFKTCNLDYSKKCIFERTIFILYFRMNIFLVSQSFSKF